MITTSTRPDKKSEQYTLATTRKLGNNSVRPTEAGQRATNFPQGVGQIVSTLLNVVANIIAAGFLFYAIFYADEWAKQLVEALK